MKKDLDALMQARQLDALLIFGNAEHNPPMYYLTGGGHINGALIVKKRGETPLLVHNDMERGEAAKTGLRLKPYSAWPMKDLLAEADSPDRVGAVRLAHILRDEGVTQGRVALYGHSEVGEVWQTVRAAAQMLPQVEFVGESGQDSVFLRAMETKDADEIARIRRMGAVTTEVVRLTADYLTSARVREDEVLLKEDGSPLTVGDMKRKIRLWLAERNAEPAAGFIFAIGRDAGLPHSTGNPADLMRLGQTIVYDIYPCEQGGGYFYDFTRTWSLGYARPEALALYEQVKAVYDECVAALEMDTPFKQYQALACERFHALGHATPMHTTAPQEGYVHSLGHGLGLNIHERPFASQRVDDSHRLRPGVVFTIEPGLYYPSRGMGFRIEDSFWARSDGSFERLADYPYDFVLPMKYWDKTA